MRTKTITNLLVAFVVMFAASPIAAGTWDGTIKLGGIYLDEKGDKSTVQETYNIYDGFNLTQLRLNGTPGSRHHFMFNLRDVNLDSRKGDFLYRYPGAFKFSAAYDQHRQVFDPQRSVNSRRKDWRFKAQLTPAKWLRLDGDFNYLTRDGMRMGFPTGTLSVLGTAYDNAMKTGGVTGEIRKGGRGFAITYRASSFSDDLNNATNRTGQLVSARLFGSLHFYTKWTHLLQAASGFNELKNSNLQHKLTSFAYTGVLQPVQQFQFKYNFDAQQVDDEATSLKTERYQNNFDATVFTQYGSVFGGYGHEFNDDEMTATSYNSWRIGTALRYQKYGKLKLRYASRVKKDEAALTLLQDIESSRFNGDLQITPRKGLVLGTGFNVASREFPDIGVTADGHSINARGHYKDDVWGGLSATYTYSLNEYKDLVSRYDANSHVVTGRIDFERVKDLRLSTGLTYLDAGKDLDIEKSIWFIEGMYTIRDDFHVDVKYNVYNYDDYILLGRYYTANVVWINVAYDLHVD